MEQPRRHLGIDVAGRLVGDEDFGPPNHCAGDRDALLLAARERRRPGRGAVGKPHPGQHLAHRGHQVALVDAGDAQRQRDIVEGGEVRDQPEILEYHADAAAEAGQARAAQLHDILAEQLDAAAGRALGEVEQLEQ